MVRGRDGVSLGNLGSTHGENKPQQKLLARKLKPLVMGVGSRYRLLNSN